MSSSIEAYIPSLKTSAGGWINFHKKLDSIFSRKEANSYWIKAWKNNGGDKNALANTKELRDYMEKKGLNLSAPTTWQEFTDRGGDFLHSLKVIVIVAISVIMVIIALRIWMNTRSNKSNISIKE